MPALGVRVGLHEHFLAQRLEFFRPFDFLTDQIQIFVSDDLAVLIGDHGIRNVLIAQRIANEKT